MNKQIKVTDNSAQDKVPVRRRSQGRQMTAVSVSLPKELNQTINGIVVKTTKSRSLVITELLERGLQK